METKRWFVVWWIILGLTLVASGSGFWLRYSNDLDNTSLITSADYYFFEKYAFLTSQDIDSVLDELQERGIGAIALKEITLTSLADRGDIRLLNWAELSAETQTLYPERWAALESAMSGSSINPLNQVMVTRNAEIAHFVETRLLNRFQPDQIIAFQQNGNYYCAIAAELTPLTVRSPENEDPALDNRLGFDETLIASLRDRGFEIILRPGNSMGDNLDYIETEWDALIQEFSIKYMVFDGLTLPGSYLSVEPIAALANKYHMITGIIEASDQLQYMEQEGLEDYMKLVEYDINRVYSSTFDEYLTQMEERYYRWVRAVVDRNVRIIYFSPFQNVKLTASENLDNSFELIGNFHDTIADKGYTLNQPLPHLNQAVPGKWHRLALCLSLLAAGILYLSYLRINRKWLWLIAGLGLAGALAANLLLNMNLVKLYALGAAILYPALSTLLLLYYVKNSDSSLWKQMLAALLLILGITALGMYTVVSSLSDLYFTMNVGIFSGVKVAFILPLLLFILQYLAVFYGWQAVKEKTLAFARQNVNYLGALSLLLLAGVAYYYLARSGHTAGATVSQVEIKIREVLELFFLARPRFKEFLIGWPCLFVLVYLYHRYRRPLLVLLLGLGVTVGCITMVNSFCHVYTAIGISFSRTLAGLLTGVIASVLALLVIRLLERLLDKQLAPFRQRSSIS